MPPLEGEMAAGRRGSAGRCPAEICRVCSQNTLYFLIAICYNALNYKKMEEASGIIPGI